MEFNEYNESVKNWTNGILDNYRKDAELTIKAADRFRGTAKDAGTDAGLCICMEGFADAADL